MQVERNWLNPDGIPGRPWFKHILYGARYTYAHLELPGLTEATEAGDWTTARQQAAILQRALSNNSELLERLNSDLGGGKTSLNSFAKGPEKLSQRVSRRDFHPCEKRRAIIS
jgi:Transferrin receptor-like dimerisation domain